MKHDKGQFPEPRPWRLIEEDHVDLSAAAFLMMHPACGEAVQISREGQSLVCWCELCRDLRTYQVEDEQGIG